MQYMIRLFLRVGQTNRIFLWFYLRIGIPYTPRGLQFNWSEHRPVKAEAAGSSPVSPELGFNEWRNSYFLFSPSQFYCLFGCLCDPQKVGHVIHTYIIVCITIRKRKGKLDKIKKDRGLEVQKRKSRKGLKKQGIPNPIKKTILVLVWIEDLPMLYYSTLNYELI